MRATGLLALLFVFVLGACNAPNTSSDEAGNGSAAVVTSESNTSAQVPQNTDYSGWHIYVTNVRENASDERGWKEVVVDVVFESNTLAPYPLYFKKYVSILDSAGYWREGVLCCSRPSSPEEVIRVPTGIRFIRTSDPIKLPEAVNIEQVVIHACEYSDCADDGAVFTAEIPEITPDVELTFPFDTLPNQIPTLTDQAVPVNIPHVTNASVTFLPGLTLTEDDWVAISFEITVENLLLGENLTNWHGNFYIDWLTTSVRDDGTLYTYGIYCEQNGDRYWEVPPGYTDTFQCNSVVTFDEDADFETLWIGFSTGNGIPFLQTVIERD